MVLLKFNELKDVLHLNKSALNTIFVGVLSYITFESVSRRNPSVSFSKHQMLFYPKIHTY